MLRVSAMTNEKDFDIQGINGNSEGAAKGIEYGTELMEFAEAFARRDTSALATKRKLLLDAAGNDVLIDAAGVAANFQRMVRIADSTGIPYDNAETDMAQQVSEELNLREFASAQNTFSN